VGVNRLSHTSTVDSAHLWSRWALPAFCWSDCRDGQRCGDRAGSAGRLPYPWNRMLLMTTKEFQVSVG